MKKSVNFGCFIKVDGPEHDYQESQNEGEYVRVYGCYRQKNRLYNQRFAFTRQYYGAGDETHSNFDERRSQFNADVEIVYDGMTWVMRRSGGGPPLAWTPPTSAFQPPHGGWITEDGIVGITISRKSPPVNLASPMLNLKELLGDKPEMKDAVGLLYAQEKRAEMAAQETQEYLNLNGNRRNYSRSPSPPRTLRYAPLRSRSRSRSQSR